MIKATYLAHEDIHDRQISHVTRNCKIPVNIVERSLEYLQVP
jgi:hypothetical protein